MRAGAIAFFVMISLAFLSSCGQKDPSGLGYGSLFVSSSPQGAFIFVDGDSTGLATPNTVYNVRWGQHTVSVSLSGYESNPALQVVEVSPGELPEIFFSLSVMTSSSRTVLVEEFTNTSCIPCAQASPILDAIVADLGRDRAVAVKYHASWPGPTDPFYLHNTADNSARINYYGVVGIPDLFVDGTSSPPSLDSAAIRADIDSRLQQPSPLVLEANYQVNGDQYSVSARIIAVSDPAEGDLVIQFVVLESGIVIDPPPGANGETHFEHIMRKMFPNADGESFTISQGDTLEFERQFSIDPVWDADNIETVVFVQSTGTREVLQACSDHE